MKFMLLLSADNSEMPQCGAPRPAVLYEQREVAAQAYQQAIALCGNLAGHAYIQRRLDELLNLEA